MGNLAGNSSLISLYITMNGSIIDKNRNVEKADSYGQSSIRSVKLSKNKDKVNQLEKIRRAVIQIAN